MLIHYSSAFTPSSILKATMMNINAVFQIKIHFLEPSDSHFPKVIFTSNPHASTGSELWGTARLCVLKEGLCEAESWLVVEGRVTVKEPGSNSSPNTSGLMLVGGGDRAHLMRCTQN